jgi:penicillin amidase
VFRLRRTHRGPLLSDAFPGYAGPPLSLRLTLHEPAADLETFLSLGRAARFEDAEPFLAAFGSPAQNLLYADRDGHAGHRLIGRVPLRAPGAAHPALPRDGRTAATDWTGWVPPAELPRASCAPDQVIVSANNPLVGPEYPHYLSHLYEPDYRARRIHERLEGQTALSAPDLAAVQLDAWNLAARWFRRLVLLPHADEVRRARPVLGPLLDRLLAWEGREEARDVGPGLWHFTYHHLLRRTFGPALGQPLTLRWMELVNLADGALRRAFEDPESPWAPPSVRATLLADALERADQDLRARGASAESSWGSLHTLTLRHPLGRARLLSAAYDRGPIPLRGGPYAVVSGQYLHSRPATVVAGASYRQVVDLADPEGTARMITLGGQSGHVGSRHYDDLTPLWLAGEGLPMRLEVEPAGGERLTLRPA